MMGKVLSVECSVWAWDQLRREVQTPFHVSDLNPVSYRPTLPLWYALYSPRVWCYQEFKCRRREPVDRERFAHGYSLTTTARRAHNALQQHMGSRLQSTSSPPHHTGQWSCIWPACLLLTRLGPERHDAPPYWQESLSWLAVHVSGALAWQVGSARAGHSLAQLERPSRCVPAASDARHSRTAMPAVVVLAVRAGLDVGCECALSGVQSL